MLCNHVALCTGRALVLRKVLPIFSRFGRFFAMAKYTVVLLRHGESEWNKSNRFTGWRDVDLTPRGIEEAQKGAKLLKEKKYEFDVAFTSLLKRAIRTLNLVLDEMDLDWIPVHKHWRLNERMYGDLEGLNKSETAAKFGEAKVLEWRRSFDIPPPIMKQEDKRWHGHDRRYANMDKSLVPLAESLKDTIDRFLPYWFDQIVPEIKSGKRVVISAHGNSLRALVKHLDNIPDSEITGMNIPTGIPLVYELDENLRPINHYYLGDEAELQAAKDRVAQQGKAK